MVIEKLGKCNQVKIDLFTTLVIILFPCQSGNYPPVPSDNVARCHLVPPSSNCRRKDYFEFNLLFRY